MCLGKISVGTRNIISQRTLNDGAAKLPVHAFDKGFDGPFSAIRQGFDDDLYGLASIGFTNAGFDGSPGFDRRQTIF